MKANIYFDPADAKNIEDGAVMNFSFNGGGVVDGASAPHSPSHPLILFDGGITGGQMVRNVVTSAFDSALPEMTLEEVISSANQEIRKRQLGKKHLAGGSFAFFQAKDGRVKIITGGDSFAFAIFKSGKVLATPNTAYEWEKERIDTFARIKKKHKGNLSKAWDEYCPIYCKFRKEQEGVCFASLNGLPLIKDLWHEKEAAIIEIGKLLLFTDGLVVFEETENPKRLAETLLPLYQKGGVEEILNHKRENERKKVSTSHINHEEMACLEVLFD